MKATIKNTSRAPQGVHTVDGIQFIDPGKTRTLDIADDYVQRVKGLSFFEIGKDIDRGPTPDDIAVWTREQLVELLSKAFVKRSHARPTTTSAAA